MNEEMLNIFIATDKIASHLDTLDKEFPGRFFLLDLLMTLSWVADQRIKDDSFPHPPIEARVELNPVFIVLATKYPTIFDELANRQGSETLELTLQTMKTLAGE